MLSPRPFFHALRQVHPSRGGRRGGGGRRHPPATDGWSKITEQGKVSGVTGEDIGHDRRASSESSRKLVDFLARIPGDRDRTIRPCAASVLVRATPAGG